MRKLALLAAGLCLLCLTPAPSEGGWGGGGCSFGPPPAMGPVGPPRLPFFLPPPPPPTTLPPAPSTPALSWFYWDGDDSQAALLENGRQVGAYSFQTGRYRPLDPLTRQWGPESDLPPSVSPPTPPVTSTPEAGRKKCRCCDACDCRRCSCTPDHKCSKDCKCGHRGEPEPQNFGLEVEKVHPGKHYLDGQEVSREQFFQVMANGVPDDAGKLRLTLIGPKADRDNVTAALKGQLASFSDKYLLQEYDPGHWAVSCGFRQDGHPSVYIQDPKGKVLWRQDTASVTDLQEGLQTALRTPDPHYDPSKDPNPNNKPKPAPGPNGGPAGDSNLLPWLVAGGLFLLLARKK